LSFGTSDVERARIDASGNLGLGVTPSAWGVFKAFQFGTVGSMSSGSGITTLGHNLYFDGTNFRYLTATNASFNEQTAGQHKWYTAPSGTANNVITFTQAMTLDASGNLGIGAIPSAASIRTLQVSSTSLSSPGTAMYLTANAVFDNPNWKYIGSTFSSQYVQINGGHQWLNAASGTAGANVSYTQAMTLDANGQLSIGTAAASSTLGRNITINGAAAGTNTGVIVSSAGVERGYVYGSDAQFAVGSIASLPLVLTTNNTERARIDSSGRFGIGTSSPDGPLQVSFADAETNQFNVGAAVGFLTNTNTTNNNWAQIFWTDSDGGPAAAAVGVQYTDHTNNYAAISLSTRGAGGLGERVRVKTDGQVRFVPLASAPTNDVQDGDVYYDSTTNKLRVRAAGAWVDLH
jgi:hypothetical protein